MQKNKRPPAPRKRSKVTTTALLNQIQRAGVVIPVRAKVKPYMERYRRLAGVLPEICGRVSKEFPGVELSLELYEDPGINDRYLTLYVRPEKFDLGLTPRIERIHEEYEDRLVKMRGYLLVMADGKRPRGNHAV